MRGFYRRPIKIARQVDYEIIVETFQAIGRSALFSMTMEQGRRDAADLYDKLRAGQNDEQPEETQYVGDGVMKKILLLVALALWAFPPCFAPLSAQAAQAPPSANKPGAELVRTMLGLYRDKRPEVRMQALYLSAGLAPHQELVSELRKRRARADPAERFAISYALATMTHEPRDITTFLQAFPVEGCTYFKAIPWSWDFLRLGAGLPRFLLMLAYENAYREQALPRFVTVTAAWEPPGYVFGDVPRHDPLVSAYKDKHPEVDHYPAHCEEDLSNAWYERPNALLDPIRKLLGSEDDISRISALLMAEFAFEGANEVREEEFGLYAKRTMAKNERMLFDNLVKYHGKDEKSWRPYVLAFPESQKELIELLEFEKSIYKMPGECVVSELMTLVRNQKDPDAAKKLTAVLQYGKKYLSKQLYEYAKIALKIQRGEQDAEKEECLLRPISNNPALIAWASCPSGQRAANAGPLAP
jgi:hypothetical protein